MRNEQSKIILHSVKSAIIRKEEKNEASNGPIEEEKVPRHFSQREESYKENQLDIYSSLTTFNENIILANQLITNMFEEKHNDYSIINDIMASLRKLEVNVKKYLSLE